MLKLKMQPTECKQEFPSIWSSDLDSNPIWPISELDLDIIKTNILTRMPFIPQRLWAPAQRDRVARLRERFAFARYRYNLFIGGLVAE